MTAIPKRSFSRVRVDIITTKIYLHVYTYNVMCVENLKYSFYAKKALPTYIYVQCILWVEYNNV